MINHMLHLEKLSVMKNFTVEKNQINVTISTTHTTPSGLIAHKTSHTGEKQTLQQTICSKFKPLKGTKNIYWKKTIYV